MNHVETLEAAGNPLIGALFIVGIFVACGIAAGIPAFLRELIDLHHRRRDVVRRNTPPRPRTDSWAPREDSDG